MTYLKTILAATAFTSYLIANPASASNQADLLTCTAALEAQSNIDMRLIKTRFLSTNATTDSNQTTFVMDVAYTTGEGAFSLICTIKENNEVQLSSKTEIANVAT